MHVFEIFVPGTWLDYEDRAWSWSVGGQIQHLQSQFFEANTALNLFAAAREDSPPLFTEESWERDSKRRFEIEELVQRERGGARTWDEEEEVRFEVDVRLKRERWLSGQTPKELERSIPFIYARTFLYALDAFDKFLGVLSKTDRVPAALSTIHERMTLAFPHLRGVRNSVQHQEDRSRRLGTGGKPLQIQAINNGMVNAPAGVVLLLNCLNGYKYGSTMADGHYGEVDVSSGSMTKLQEILQSVVEEFKWKGGRQHLPMS